MTDKTAEGITINILGKEYMIACGEDERHDLQRSADFLDTKMREIRDNGKIVGSDRIAIIAALNISHELLTQSEGSAKMDTDIDSRIRSIQDKIDNALERSREANS
jgi:cell division protein ZapA